MKLNEQLKKRFEADQVPSVALEAVVKDNKYECFYGAYNEDGDKPTGSTLYGVASLTKSMTAVAIMKLQDDGKLSVTDLIKEWLPEINLPNQSENKITIHHLLTHTAGFPGMNAFNLARLESLERDPDGLKIFGAFPKYKKQVVTIKDMIEAMNDTDYDLIAEPGTLFNYSNEGYALLEEIIKRASNESYINYIKKIIFDPLNMNHSVFTVDELDHYPEVAHSYAFTKNKERKRYYSPTWWESGEIYGAGALKSTTSDILKYLEIFKGNQILSEQALEAMTKVHVKTPNENKYGYGLLVGEFDGKKVVGHGGGVKGISSYMFVCKELDFTAVALTNIAEISAEDYILSVFNQITGIDVSIPIKTSASLPDLAKYTGIYASNEGNEIKINEGNSNQLTMEFDHNSLELTHEKDDIFILPNGKKVAFVLQDEEVVGIFRGMRFLNRLC